MKKYRLNNWVKVTIMLMVAMILLISCYKALSYLDKAEKDRAYSEGRYEEHYTTTGEIYYK